MNPPQRRPRDVDAAELDELLPLPVPLPALVAERRYRALYGAAGYAPAFVRRPDRRAFRIITGI